MAIRLEFINLIVPIRVIDQKFEGGWEQFSRDYGLDGATTVAGSCWRDNKLFRDGAMNPMDMHFMSKTGKTWGFEVQGSSMGNCSGKTSALLEV